MAAVEHAAQLVVALEERVRLIDQQRRREQFDRPENRPAPSRSPFAAVAGKTAQHVKERRLAASLLGGRDRETRAVGKGVQGVSVKRPERDRFGLAVFHDDVSAERRRNARE